MSAFVCSKSHIAAIASFAVSKQVWTGTGSAKLADYKSIYKALAEANVRSVCHRYADDSADNYSDLLRVPKHSPVQYSPIQIVKLCDCLDYQSCETEDWRESPECKLLENIKQAAVCSIPGYDEAKWAVA
jgi:hypothetical protein